MSQLARFKAIQLTRWGQREEKIAENTELTLKKPLYQPLARLFYDALFELSCTAVEWYTVPGSQQLSQYVTVVPPGDGSSREEYLRPLGHDAADALPQSVSVVLTTVDLAPLGSTPAPTHRLLTKRDDLSSWDGSSVESGLSQFSQFIIEHMTRMEPSLLKVSIRRTMFDEIKISAWWIDYAPSARCLTRDEFTRYQFEGDWPSLAAAFGGSPLTTNLELPTEYGCEYTSLATGGNTDTLLYELPPEEGAAGGAKLAIKLAQRRHEYFNSTTITSPNLTSNDETVSRDYQRMGVNPWLTIESEQLAGFCGLPAVFYPESTWLKASSRLEPLVQTHESFRQRRNKSENTHAVSAPVAPRTIKQGTESPAVCQSREFCATDADSTATPTETAEQSPNNIVQTTVIRLLERGDDLQSLSIGPPEMRFKATTPAGTTSSVLVDTAPLTAMSVVAAAAVTHRSPDIDALTIVTESSDAADQVSRWLQEPYDYRTVNGGVRLYRGFQPIANETHQAVHPPTAKPEEWYIFPEGTVVCVHDDEICTSVPLSKLPSQQTSNAALSTALLAELPAEYKTSNEDAGGTATDNASVTHIQPQDAYAMRTPVWLPHVASGLIDTTILITTTEGFVEYRPTPNWDQQDAATEAQQAAAAFITRYLIDADGQTVALDDAVSLFCAWYYAHEGSTPLSDPTTAFKQGYNRLYDNPLGESSSTVPNCRWLYPPQ